MRINITKKIDDGQADPGWFVDDKKFVKRIEPWGFTKKEKETLLVRFKKGPEKKKTLSKCDSFEKEEFLLHKPIKKTLFYCYLESEIKRMPVFKVSNIEIVGFMICPTTMHGDGVALIVSNDGILDIEDFPKKSKKLDFSKENEYNFFIEKELSKEEIIKKNCRLIDGYIYENGKIIKLEKSMSGNQLIYIKVMAKHFEKKEIYDRVCLEQEQEKQELIDRLKNCKHSWNLFEGFPGEPTTGKCNICGRRAAMIHDGPVTESDMETIDNAVERMSN